MAFVDDLKVGIERAIRIVQLDKQAIAAVAADANAFPVGIAIVAIGGVASGIGSLRQGVGHAIGQMIFGPMGAVVGSFIGVGILYLVGMLIKPARWDFMELYRAVSHASILSWIGVVWIVPYLGALVALAAWIYSIVVNVIVVETVGQTDRTKAMMIVLIPTIVCCVIGGAILFTIGAAILAMIGMGAAAAQ